MYMVVDSVLETLSFYFSIEKKQEKVEWRQEVYEEENSGQSHQAFIAKI